MNGFGDRFDRGSGRGRGWWHCCSGRGGTGREGRCETGGAAPDEGWDASREWPGTGRRTLYRARDGKLMGVCKGLAQHFGMSVFMVRALFVAAALFTGFWPVVGLYVLAGLVMKPRPVLQPADAGERDFYGSYVSSRAEALRRLKEKFDRLEGRIRRMEDVVTRRDFDWDRRFGAQR